MNSYFNSGDWVIILFYFFGIIGLGVWFGKDQRNTRDYFLGSKNIQWWGIGLSIVAAETSALTIIGVPAIAYGGNLFFLQIDRKSTRLNSSHLVISYAVFCLEKKKKSASSSPCTHTAIS